MKKPLLLLLLMIVLCSMHLKAQCNLKPVIAPSNLLLCPNSSDSIYTTKEYDSYQWFHFNKAIPGATQRFLVVNYTEDAGALFKVKVTKGNCTDTSKKVLVDGYAFASPVIITNGTPSYFDVKTETSVFCKNEPVSLTFPEPYTTNVQWYNNGSLIPGADSSTYTVTSNGSYTVCGSPQVCPAYTECEGLPVNISIDRSTPSVLQQNDTLLATGGVVYQWYFNGNRIPGADSRYYVPAKKGLYSVTVTDKYNCTASSKPIFISPKQLVVIAPNPAQNFIIVHCKSDNAAQIVISDVYGSSRKQVQVTSKEQKVSLEHLPSGNYIVHITDKNKNEIGNAKLMKQ